jgi:hypothetical protein
MNPDSASAPLGALVASATAVITGGSGTITATAEALLGSLIADATATITSSNPTEQFFTGGYHGPAPYRQPAKQTIKEPEHQPIYVDAQAKALLGSLKSGAISSITFSILEDDADVLLLV